MLRSEAGQAILEYILILGIAVSLAVTLHSAVRKNVNRFWLELSCEIAAPCPTCRDSTQSLKAAEIRLGIPGACRGN